jgi:hypothetical protein
MSFGISNRIGIGIGLKGAICGASASIVSLFGGVTTPIPPPVVVTNYILVQDASFFLMENASKVVLET